MWKQTKKYKSTYLQNRNRLTDIENKFVHTKRERGGGGIHEEYGIKRYIPLYIKKYKQQGFTV